MLNYPEFNACRPWQYAASLNDGLAGTGCDSLCSAKLFAIYIRARGCIVDNGSEPAPSYRLQWGLLSRQ